MFKTIYKEYVDAFSGLPKVIWFLALVMFINRCGTMVLPFLSLYFTKELGMTASSAGLLVSTYGIGALVGSVTGGWLADHWGPLKTQAAFLVAGGIAFAVLGQVDGIPAIVTWLLISSGFSEGVRPANVTATSLYVPLTLRARSFALNRLAVNLGIAVGPAIGGFLAGYRYSLIFWGEAITCLIAAVAMYVFFKNVHPKVYDDNPVDEKRKGGLDPLSNRSFLLFILLTLPITLGFFQVFVTMPIFLKDHYGLAETGFGLIMTMNGITIALFEMILIHKTEHISPLRLAAYGSILMCGGLGLMPLSTWLWFPFFATFVWTIGEMLNMPASMAQISLWAPTHLRGRYVSVYSATWGLSFVLGPVIGGYIYEHHGAFWLWGGIGVIGSMAGFGMLMQARKEDRRRLSAQATEAGSI